MNWHDALEPERYELSESPAYSFAPSRRGFLASTGGILVICLASPALGRQVQEGSRGPGPQDSEQIGAWLHIDEDGRIIIYTGKVEVGQGIRTSLAQVVAEELNVSMQAVRLVMGDTATVPYDRGTFGSRTTPSMAPQIAKAAVAAREMLLELASERWRTPSQDLRIADGRIHHPDGRRVLTFAELTQGERLVRSIGPDASPTPASAWRRCGKSSPNVNGRELVTGRHRFASDVRRPGMLYGKILRPPASGCEPLSVDLSKAKALPGAVAVHDGAFIGVAAPDTAAAAHARSALQVEWSNPSGQVSDDTLFEHLKRTSSDSGGGGRGRRGRNVRRGSIDAGLAEADHVARSSYRVAYIAHAPLEPRAAVAEWTEGKLSVWTGTQRPFGVREELAQAFGLSDENVRVRVPDTGSGYGGKHTGEVAVEAARLSRAAGKPVKVVWTREEEFQWAYFRPAGVIEIESGATRSGKLTAWRCTNYNSGSSAIAPLYAVPNVETTFRRADSPLRQGSYRALAATANVFARESHMDEIAAASSADPLEIRLRNLEDPRLSAVLRAAAETFGWATRERETHRGFGLACGFDKGGYTANCVQISLDPRLGEVRVDRVVAAFECGAIYNPDNLRNQIEGSIVQGLGGALYERIKFKDGRILNPAFADYRVPRFLDVPPIETVLVDRPDLPSAGAGETPIVCIAPAIANAIFDATGERRRALPLG